MTFHSDLIYQIAKNICRFRRCNYLYNDLCQIGELIADRLSGRSNAYIAVSIRNAMLKEVLKKRPVSLRELDIPITSNIELTPEFYLAELVAPDKDRSIFRDHYINNIPVNQIAKNNGVSISTIYRILSKLKKDFIDVI